MPRPSKIAEAAKKAAWAKNHSKEAKNSTESNSPQRPAWIDYPVVRLGVPLGFVALGITLMLASVFNAGAIVLYVGLLAIPVDFWFEPFFAKLKLHTRFIFLLIYVLAISIVSWEWVFVPAHFELSANSVVPHYGPGSRIDGIPWRDEYSQLDFRINNKSDIDYENFDVEISTDLVIADMRMVNDVSECKIAGVNTPVPAHWQREEGGKLVGPADSPEYTYKITPIGPNANTLLLFPVGTGLTVFHAIDFYPAVNWILSLH
jgi:hypothetical protein